MAGPVYCAAVVPVSTKMPAPMIAPIPSVIRFTGPSTRLSECSPTCPASSRRVLSGFRISMLAIVSVEVIACNITLALPDFLPDCTCATVKQRSPPLFTVTLVASFFLCALSAQTPARQNSTAIQFDLGAIDRSADPCVDFYQYACGSWMKKNPIPPDQAEWGRFDELQERNQTILRQILDEAAKPVPGRDAVTQKIGDFYAACMDEKAIDAKTLTPPKPEFAPPPALQEKPPLPGEIAPLHGLGIATLFQFNSGQDFKDSNSVIAQFDQGGLGLPDRDYYLKDDPKSVELRQKY